MDLQQKFQNDSRNITGGIVPGLKRKTLKNIKKIMDNKSIRYYHAALYIQT